MLEPSVRVFHDFKSTLPQLVEAPPPSSTWKSTAAFFCCFQSNSAMIFISYTQKYHILLCPHVQHPKSCHVTHYERYMQKKVFPLRHLIYSLMRMETHFPHGQGRSS